MQLELELLVSRDVRVQPVQLDMMVPRGKPELRAQLVLLEKMDQPAQQGQEQLVQLGMMVSLVTLVLKAKPVQRGMMV